MELTHFNEQGRARMVDVSEKPATYRTARACATVRMARGTMELIPMCHPLLLTKADITFQAEDETLHIFSEIRCRGETGVEMEALTAVSVAALTVYDMCKAVQRDMVITDVRLLYKDGGKSGTYEVK